MYESCSRTSFINYWRLNMLGWKKNRNAVSFVLSQFFKILLLYVFWLFARVNAESSYVGFYILLTVCLIFYGLPVAFPVLIAALRSYFSERKRPPSRLVFQDDRIHSDREDKISENDYSEIEEILEIGDSIILVLDSSRAYLISKKDLIGGDPESFPSFIGEKCSLPVRKLSGVLSYRKE